MPKHNKLFPERVSIPYVPKQKVLELIHVCAELANLAQEENLTISQLKLVLFRLIDHARHLSFRAAQSINYVLNNNQFKINICLTNAGKDGSYHHMARFDTSLNHINFYASSLTAETKLSTETILHEFWHAFLHNFHTAAARSKSNFCKRLAAYSTYPQAGPSKYENIIPYWNLLSKKIYFLHEIAQHFYDSGFRLYGKFYQQDKFVQFAQRLQMLGGYKIQHMITLRSEWSQYNLELLREYGITLDVNTPSKYGTIYCEEDPKNKYLFGSNIGCQIIDNITSEAVSLAVNLASQCRTYMYQGAEKIGVDILNQLTIQKLKEISRQEKGSVFINQIPIQMIECDAVFQQFHRTDDLFSEIANVTRTQINKIVKQCPMSIADLPTVDPRQSAIRQVVPTGARYEPQQWAGTIYQEMNNDGTYASAKSFCNSFVVAFFMTSAGILLQSFCNKNRWTSMTYQCLQLGLNIAFIAAMFSGVSLSMGLFLAAGLMFRPILAFLGVSEIIIRPLEVSKTLVTSCCVQGADNPYSVAKVLLHSTASIFGSYSAEFMNKIHKDFTQNSNNQTDAIVDVSSKAG